MADELVMAVATALATGGADAVVAEGRTALGTLLRKIRDRIGTGTPEAAILDAAVAEPGTRQQAQLGELLARLMTDDPHFAAYVRSYHNQTTREPTADREAVVNYFHGSADKVLQARDIHGNVSL